MGKQTTRETLIEVGLGLIHTAGYTATGINQVLEAAKVPKGSFYHHFTTKDEFVLEVIQRYAAGEQERWEDSSTTRTCHSSPKSSQSAVSASVVPACALERDPAGVERSYFPNLTGEAATLMRKRLYGFFRKSVPPCIIGTRSCWLLMK